MGAILARYGRQHYLVLRSGMMAAGSSKQARRQMNRGVRVRSSTRVPRRTKGAELDLRRTPMQARGQATFERILELDPSAPYAHCALGRSLKRLGRREEARTHLRMACALSPESSLYRDALASLGPPPEAGSRPPG